MAVKYYCDVCNREIINRDKINIWSIDTKFSTICALCWKMAEKALDKLHKLESARGLL